MKKLILLSAGTLIGGMLAAQSIPNGTFESWNTVGYNDPMYYNTSNDKAVPLGFAPNVTETTGYLGVNYGVQAETIGTAGNANAGYLIDADVNNSSTPTGGIPSGWTFPTQIPTGIRFYYQYTPVSNDTAAVLVFFKKAGNIIDTFLITLPTAESSYTLHSYHPATAVPVTPDTVVFGAVSSIKIFGNNGGSNAPIGSTLVIDSVTFTGVPTQPAELNGDFQQWTPNTVLTPSSWYTNFPAVTRTDTAASGNYALRLRTLNTSTEGIEVGQASTGYYPNNCSGNCYEQGGDPYTVTGTGKDTLEFAYEYLPAGADTANVGLAFIKNGQTVYGGGFSIYGTTSTYTEEKYAFDLSGVSPVPDTVIVSLQSSSHNHDTTSAQYAPYVGTNFLVDNMTFASQASTLGINTISAAAGIRIFPNPAYSQINVDLTNVSGSLQTIAIYDMSGRMLTGQSYSGGVRNPMETIDISGFSDGVYLIEATTTNGKFYQKVVKQ